MSGYGYTCVGGETWDSIAHAIYGDEKYAADLICANPEYSHYSIFGGGEVLYLPVVVAPEDDDATMPATAPWKEA
ncbi:MAG: hypothetical protein IJ523_10590 [Succinivibrionaceae bacterium]|nr:hypothetical protein [Succinivibrionaceae bacterium]